jgi:hypothetical protein
VVFAAAACTKTQATWSVTLPACTLTPHSRCVYLAAAAADKEGTAVPTDRVMGPACSAAAGLLLDCCWEQTSCFKPWLRPVPLLVTLLTGHTGDTGDCCKQASCFMPWLRSIALLDTHTASSMLR